MMVPGLVPDGCLAVSLTYFGSPNKDTGCITWLNNFAEFHNGLLQKRLNMLRKLHPHADIIYADYFSAAMQLYTSPEEYGSHFLIFSRKVFLIDLLKDSK